MLDYLWAGLPIVATQGDAFAELIEREGLGLTVPAEDPAALEQALSRLLEDWEFAEECRAQVAEVRERFRWSLVLDPLVSYCRHPQPAPDLLAVHPHGAAPSGGDVAGGPDKRSFTELVRFHYRQGGVGQVVKSGEQSSSARPAGVS